MKFVSNGSIMVTSSSLLNITTVSSSSSTLSLSPSISSGLNSNISLPLIYRVIGKWYLVHKLNLPQLFYQLLKLPFSLKFLVQVYLFSPLTIQHSNKHKKDDSLFFFSMLRMSPMSLLLELFQNSTTFVSNINIAK